MYRCLIALALALAILPAHVHAAESAVSGCGVERWPEKVGNDSGATRVDLTRTTWTSPARLSALPHPATLPQNSRIAPVETTQYRMTVTLTQYKTEADSDVHAVVSGSNGVRMIVELPSPACVGASSPFLGRITTARTSFDQQFHPSGTWQYSHAMIRVTGVGFYDFLHNQTGVARSGVELHPVTGLRVLSG